MTTKAMLTGTEVEQLICRNFPQLRTDDLDVTRELQIEGSSEGDTRSENYLTLILRDERFEEFAERIKEFLVHNRDEIGLDIWCPFQDPTRFAYSIYNLSGNDEVWHDNFDQQFLEYGVLDQELIDSVIDDFGGIDDFDGIIDDNLIVRQIVIPQIAIPQRTRVDWMSEGF